MKKPVFRSLLALTLALSLAAALPGCGREPAPDPEPLPPSDEEALPSVDAPDTADPLYVADLPRYRGTAVTLEADDTTGELALVLEAFEGSGAVAPFLKVGLDEFTRANFDLSALAEGDHLEVYYRTILSDELVPEGEEVFTAVAINKLMPAEAVYYNGILVEVADTGSGRQLILQNMGVPEGTPEEELYQFQTVFNVSSDTQMYVSDDALQPGVPMNIYHKGIYAASLPPQGIALEVRPMS